MPLFREMKITYLHYAILNDAPIVVTSLVKYGTYVYEEARDYPDLTPLYLGLAKPHERYRDLDRALWIASSYALPRTCEYLLQRGACPNNLSSFGLGAMHLVVRRRLPWRKFTEIRRAYQHGHVIPAKWPSLVLRTLSILLHFGGDPNLKSATSRVHKCGPWCWSSLDCEHRGQRVLHFASASGAEDVVSLLLDNGADPCLYDDDGYLPLYPALAQGHCSIALCFLKQCSSPEGLIVIQPSQSTALHIACRFVCLQVVLYLLKQGAHIDLIDFVGRTALHEALGQNNPRLEDNVVQTVQYLVQKGAREDLDSICGTAAYMARTHNFSKIRSIFDSPISDSLVPPPPIPDDLYYEYVCHYGRQVR